MSSAFGSLRDLRVCLSCELREWWLGNTLARVDTPIPLPSSLIFDCPGVSSVSRVVNPMTFRKTKVRSYQKDIDERSLVRVFSDQGHSKRYWVLSYARLHRNVVGDNFLAMAGLAG